MNANYYGMSVNVTENGIAFSTVMYRCSKILSKVKSSNGMSAAHFMFTLQQIATHTPSSKHSNSELFNCELDFVELNFGPCITGMLVQNGNK